MVMVLFLVGAVVPLGSGPGTSLSQSWTSYIFKYHGLVLFLVLFFVLALVLVLIPVMILV